MRNHIIVTLSGISFSCRFRFYKTKNYFQKPVPGTDCVGNGFVCLSNRDWNYFISEGIIENAHSEFSLLSFPFSEALLPYNRVLLHGVALRWNNKAWLICAGSGVGKTTQAKNLQMLRPGEFDIICGDRPVLQFEDKNYLSNNNTKQRNNTTQVIVHPSPWNGKENLYGADAAPLAGVILLQRGPENRLYALQDKEAVLDMYPNFIHLGWDPEVIKRVAEIETKLLQSVPIWKLTTHDVPASTKLLVENVFVDDK